MAKRTTTKKKQEPKIRTVRRKPSRKTPLVAENRQVEHVPFGDFVYRGGKKSQDFTAQHLRDLAQKIKDHAVRLENLARVMEKRKIAHVHIEAQGTHQLAYIDLEEWIDKVSIKARRENYQMGGSDHDFD